MKRVADLPEKHEVQHCKNIPISTLQSQLYIDTANHFRKLSAEGNQGAMLGHCTVCE
jgi:hypothetical protein